MFDSDHDFGVFYVGGSIGERKVGVIRHFSKGLGMLVATFEDVAGAKSYASRRRKSLSPGEKKYYGMSYLSAKLTPEDKAKIEKL